MAALVARGVRWRRSVAHFRDILNRYPSKRVLVLGDIVADEYLVGRPDRISREAPVLILHYKERFIRPGGATNSAYNMRALGATTALVGIVGDDEMGHQLLDVLRRASINIDGLIVDPARPTSTKTRVLAQGTQEIRQQIVRIDRIDDRDLDGGLRDQLVDVTRRAVTGADAMLISDYENGVISEEILEACLPQAREAECTVTVDSHGDLFRFKGVTAATPNQPEAENTLGHRIRTERDLFAAGEELLEGMQAKAVLITRGSEGLALFQPSSEPYILPISTGGESDLVDPTGAGETVAAAFTLAIASGATMREAAYLGNLAAGEVVRKLGAATLTTEELGEAADHSFLPPPT